MLALQIWRKLKNWVEKMRFKEFEIRPIIHSANQETRDYELVKWFADDHCYAIARIYWDLKESCWGFESYGTRFFDDYVSGLAMYVKKYIEFLEVIRTADGGKKLE